MHTMAIIKPKFETSSTNHIRFILESHKNLKNSQLFEPKI